MPECPVRNAPALFRWVCLHRIRSMHEVVPRVVAIAVRMVMANWMIFCQSSFFMFFMYDV